MKLRFHLVVVTFALPSHRTLQTFKSHSKQPLQIRNSKKRPLGMAHRIKLRSDDFDVIGAVPRDLSVIKNFLKRDCAVKRLIEIEEDFVKKCMEYEAKANECSDENNKKKRKRTSEIPTPPPPDPCARSTPPGEGGLDYCDPCRRLKTSVVLEEV